MADARPILELRGITKRFPGIVANDAVDFDLRKGEVHALLGENGAGKSTTVEILEGHREGTSGTVRVLDRDPWNAGREFRDRIGIVLESSGIETEFTVREVVELYGSCYRSPRQLDEVVGHRQRVGAARRIRPGRGTGLAPAVPVD